MLKKTKSKRPGKPAQPAAGANLDPQLMAMTREVGRLLDENEEAPRAFAEMLQSLGDQDPEVVLSFLTRQLGKKMLPLLRGLALDEDERTALAALKALPLLGTRAAGEVLAEAYAAHSEGERGRAAWTGVQALQARGINIEVPEPEGVRSNTEAFQLREIWESLPDAVGSRQTFARIQDRYGVWQVVAVVSNDRAGLKDAFVAPLGANEWRKRVEQWRGAGIMMDQIPDVYARWRVEQMRQLNEKTELPVPEPVAAWDKFVGPVSESYEPPDPTHRVRTKSAEEKEELLGHMGCLMHAPAFQAWAIEPADVQPWREDWVKIVEEQDPSTEEGMEALQALAERIVPEAISAETIDLYRDRLLDCARKLEWWGLSHEADVAASVVVALDEGTPAGKIGFFQELVFTALQFLEEILEDGEDPEQLRYDPLAPIE